jgi:hypothetical protein
MASGPSVRWWSVSALNPQTSRSIWRFSGQRHRINRKEGTQVFYALRDPLLSEVLRNMRRYFQAHVEEALEMLGEL